MPLPSDLQLSQASLQDFVDCRRRFQLRHVLHQAWPALAVEPALENERHLRQGETFHRMIHQHVLGVSAARLSQMTAVADADVNLARWWQAYLDSGSTGDGEPGERHAEIVLSAPLADYTLVAKYDLIVVHPGQQATIWDWKTTRKRPGRAWLASRLQTRVYPYLLVAAGAHLNEGQPMAPEQVEMVYWFANHPDRPERFIYTTSLHQENAEYLAALVREMEVLAETEDIWPLTPSVEPCRFCVYRSLCDRGRQAGSLDEMEGETGEGSDLDFDIDLEQVAEIAY